MPDSRPVSQHVSPDSEREPRDVVVEAMAAAGQKLAVQWGHQPWSDSWAKLVAETFVDALTVIDGGWICEAVVTGPDALFCGDCMAPARPGCDYSGHGVTTLGELMEAYR